MGFSGRPHPAALRRGGLAITAGAAEARAAAPTPAARAAAAPPGPRVGWGVADVWRSLSAGVEWTLPFVGFLVYVATVVSNRFTVAQPAVVVASLGLLTQRATFRVGGLGALFAAYVAWAGFGVMAAGFRSDSVDALIQLVKLLVIIVLGVNAIRTRAQLRFVTAFILFWYAVYPVRGAYLNYITGANLKFGRVIWNGAYGNPNDLAAISLLMLGLCTAMVAEERAGLARTAARIGVPVIALLITLTQSRGAMVAMAVFGLITFLTAGSMRRRVRTALAGLAAGAVLLIFAPDSVWERMRGLVGSDPESELSIDRDSSARQRLAIWSVARTIIAEHPVTGVGIGGYPRVHEQTALRPEFDPIARGGRDTHSTYMNVMAEVGVPGFCLFFGLLGYTLFVAERARRRLAHEEPAAARALLMLELGLVAYLVAGIWGSYAKINLTYLMMVLVWVRARDVELHFAASPPAGGLPPAGGAPRFRGLAPPAA